MILAEEQEKKPVPEPDAAQPDAAGKPVTAGEEDITNRVSYFLKYGLIGLVIIAVVAAGGIYFWQSRHSYMSIYDAQVSSSLVGAKVQADGTITEMMVGDGDHVEAGDVIAHVQVKVTDEQIDQLQQTVELSQKNLEQLQKGITVQTPSAAAAPSYSSGASSQAAQEHLAQAQSRLNRMNELYQMGAVSAMKRDEAAADVAAAQAEVSASSAPAASPAPSLHTTTQPADPKVLAQAEAQLKQAKAALENAKQASQATEIVAPVAGTVYYTDVREGTDVKAGQIIVNIGDAGNVWVEAKLDEEQAQKIRLGQFAEYTVDGHKLNGSVQDIIAPDDNGQGTLSQSDGSQASGAASENDSSTSSDNNSQPATSATGTDGGAPEPRSDGKTIVRISIPGDLSFDIKPGMKAEVRFDTKN